MNLESDLYAVAKSLAKAEDCSISVAVNRLLRRSLSSAAKQAPLPKRRQKRNGFIVSTGRRVITADTVRQAEMEDDET